MNTLNAAFDSQSGELAAAVILATALTRWLSRRGGAAAFALEASEPGALPVDSAACLDTPLTPTTGGDKGAIS